MTSKARGFSNLLSFLWLLINAEMRVSEWGVTYACGIETSKKPMLAAWGFYCLLASREIPNMSIPYRFGKCQG